jgi:hypothetical protein
MHGHCGLSMGCEVSPAEPWRCPAFKTDLKLFVKGFLHACKDRPLRLRSTPSPALPLTIYGVSSLLTCSCPCREHSARVPGGVLGVLAEHTAHANADSCH